MSEVLPFGNNTIQVFAYENFDYTISNPFTSLNLQNVSNTVGLNPSSSYFTKTGDLRFRFSVEGISNNLTPGTTESFTLRVNDAGGNIVATSANTVTIGPGRLLDSNAVSLNNTSYTFFRNESISQTLRRPFRVVSPSFALNTPTSSPSLPPGLTFTRVNSTTFDIVGTPLVPVPSTTYKIIGVGGGKVATADVRIIISNDRLQINVAGDQIINGMEIGVPITPRVLTAILPAGSSTIRYSFPTLPDGIVAQNILGSNVSSPFFPSDPSLTMIIAGTPTLAAAQSFDSCGTSITVRGNSGLLENAKAFTFAFGETVLFNTPTLSNNFVGIPMDPSLNFFFAKTYFTNDVPITSISASSLPDGLSLDFISAQSRANLTGTPLSAGSTSHTITASNANGKSAEIVVTIPILNDTVSFSSPVGIDLCYNFILSRPLTQFKPGFYDSNIRFTASAASGRPVSLSAPALAGTGLSLDSNGVLVGFPSTITPLSDLNVIATLVGSPATETKTVKFAVLDDTITLGGVSSASLSFAQNVPITPFQVPIESTLSGRNVIAYSQTGFPDGIIINSAGVVSGTPTVSTPANGNVSITATTGYAQGTRDFSYNLTPDAILFTVPQTTYTYEAGDAVIIPVTATAYSGATVSNFVLGLPSTYGLNIHPSSGVISGTWTTGVPPEQILPASLTFNITAQSGIVGSFPVSFTTTPVLEQVSFLWSSNILYANGSNVTDVFPVPVARYDFNNYTALSSTLASSVPTAGAATILRPTLNTFVTSPGNNSLNIFGPFTGDLQQTGGVQLPLISNVRAIEAWVRYPLPANPNYGQFFIDARSGSANGFWITGTSSTDQIGSDYNGATIYFNGSNVTINSGAGTPDIGATLVANGGWVQVVIVPNAPITDDISMFVRFSGQQGMPVFVADIAIYQTDITKSQIEGLYNSKRSRFGLPFIPFSSLPVLPGNGFDIVIRNERVDGNLIMATASNSIVRSTYKLGFSANEIGNTTNRQICSSLAFKAPADWWVSGTRNYAGTQLANVLYSDDGGISWGDIGTIPTVSRDSNSPTGSSNPYLCGGIALKYKSGVLMAGGVTTDASGSVMIRSLDDGETWSDVSGGFAQEAAYFNFDASSIWVATGSDKYKTLTVNPASWANLGSANTIKYSTNQGQTWSNALSGAFTMFGYELIYANNTWVATGVDGVDGVDNGPSSYDILMKYSTDGSNWSNVALPFSITSPLFVPPVPVAPLPVGSMNYDGSNWNVFAQRFDASMNTWVSQIYRSPNIASSSWTPTDVTNFPSAVPNNEFRRFVSLTRPQLLRPTESKIITITVSFASSITGGPVITSPASSSFLLYQYIQTSIQLSSSGNNVFFFIEKADLPPGLNFNQNTNIISGKPSQIGNYSTTIFAKDANGVTIQTLEFRVIIPSIIRKQDGAGAYTSLLRQYTEVLGAQNARDNRALPNQERSLGSFMSPEGPDVVTSVSKTTNCVICQKVECPNGNLNVEGGNTQTVTCSVLDGNLPSGVFVDAGNAAVNICE